jgi:hypothetical protein
MFDSFCAAVADHLDLESAAGVVVLVVLDDRTTYIIKSVSDLRYIVMLPPERVVGLEVCPSKEVKVRPRPAPPRRWWQAPCRR